MINLPETELLAQLAEELMEAGHAALKLRRVLDGTNPTPVTEAEARARLIEELSDVKVCTMALNLHPDRNYIIQKTERWRRRLKEAKDNGKL